MNVSDVVVGLIAGAIGVAYFVYGRRTAKFAPVVAGVLLCVYPYFVDGLLWQCVVGVVLIAAPFVIDF